MDMKGTTTPQDGEKEDLPLIVAVYRATFRDKRDDAYWEVAYHKATNKLQVETNLKCTIAEQYCGMGAFGRELLIRELVHKTQGILRYHQAQTKKKVKGQIAN